MQHIGHKGVGNGAGKASQRFWERRQPTPATRYMREHSFQFGDMVLAYHDNESPELESGCRMLAAAVVQQAVQDFKDYYHLRGQNERQWDGRRVSSIFADAAEWLFSDDDSWPFSFVCLAAHLDLNVDRVREALNSYGDQRARVLSDPASRTELRLEAASGVPRPFFSDTPRC